MFANLILLGIAEFDVILGMDWLSTHHAMVYCYNKVLKFCTPNEPRFQFVGEKSGSYSYLMHAGYGIARAQVSWLFGVCV